jgi:hypothetical protein
LHGQIINLVTTPGLTLGGSLHKETTEEEEVVGMMTMETVVQLEVVGGTSATLGLILT